MGVSIEAILKLPICFNSVLSIFYVLSGKDSEFYQTIYYEAMMMGANPKEVLEHYEKNNMIPALKMTILENKILNNLLESTIKKD